MSGPHISIPRPYGGSTTFGSTAPDRRRSEMGMPRFFKRLFKFPQMDFEMAIWEMTHLMYQPKKVFKSIYYHKQTKNTWHRPDPSFTYLLSFFLLLTSFAWSLAYTPTPSSITKLALLFIFVHLLLGTLLSSTLTYLLVSRLLTSSRTLPGLLPSRVRRRQHGLFAPPPNNNNNTGSGSGSGITSSRGQQGGGAGGSETLEFGYSFDIHIRAFFPVYICLYVVQFLLMPVLAHHNPLSTVCANTLYLAAQAYWTVIIFLGYNSLHFLHHTEWLLTPLVAWVLLWLAATLTGWNMAEHVGTWMFWGVKRF